MILELSALDRLERDTSSAEARLGRGVVVRVPACVRHVHVWPGTPRPTGKYFEFWRLSPEIGEGHATPGRQGVPERTACPARRAGRGGGRAFVVTVILPIKNGTQIGVVTRKITPTCSYDMLVVEIYLGGRAD